jgi:cytochrome b
MKVRVWDLPLRLFHWTLATLVIAAIVTVKIGGNALQWHFYCGYAVLALLAFRLVWGVFGTRYARFSSFGCSPSAVIKHLRDLKNGHASSYLGHTPIGSLSVLVMLIVVLLQVTSGLFSNDDIDSEGPLVKFISKALSDRISWFHTEVNAWLIYALIGLHIAAVGFYYFKKNNDLVTPMLTGDKEWAHTVADVRDDVRDTWGRRSVALLIFGACMLGVYYLVNAS